MKIKLEVTRNRIATTLASVEKELASVPPQAHQQMVQLTPKDRGNARNKTTLYSKSVIQANYPYAKRLDEGYSKQAPRGMTRPLKEWLKRKLQLIMRKR